MNDLNNYIETVIKEYLKENSDLDIKKMYGWYPSFKDRYYKDIESAYNDIKQVIDHNNKQFGKIFGEDKPEDIIKLFNFIETKRGIKIQPKLKQPEEKKLDLEYQTNSDLVNKQKRLWSDTRGIEIGRYLSKLKYIDTNDSRIYGTEKPEEQNILDIIKKLKNGDELPPILLDYDYGILDGHHRWEAAKRLKIKKIPVIIYENPNEIIKEEIQNYYNNYIKWSDLDNDTQVDIIENIYHNSPYLENNWNIWTFKEYVDDALDLPELKIEYKDVDNLHNQMQKRGWGISDKQLQNLINILKSSREKDLDPIIVDNNEFFDGGHRLTAYKKLNRKQIPTIDISPLLKMDWEKWLDDE